MPTDSFLPTDYVAKEELRLEAYRRLAEVTSDAVAAPEATPGAEPQRGKAKRAKGEAKPKKVTIEIK